MTDPLFAARIPARILIAEDHLDSRDALATLLEAVGYTVLLAGDGREALDAARRVAPDLLLMDMMMPGMDGFQALREMRRDPRLAGMPIIAVTAMEGAEELARRAGADDFVAKPVDARALLARISEWLLREPEIAPPVMP